MPESRLDTHKKNLCLARSCSSHLSDFRGYEGMGLTAYNSWRGGNKLLIYACNSYRSKPLRISYLNLCTSAITKAI